MCGNRSPIRHSFRAGAEAIWYSVIIASVREIFKNNNTVNADVRASKNKDDSFFYAFPQSFRTTRDDVLGVFLYNTGPRLTKAS